MNTEALTTKPNGRAEHLPARHERFTVKGMLMDLFFSVVHVEKKGLIHTIRELTVRPADAIKKVIHQDRHYLYPPFKYLVLVGAIVIIFSLRYKFFHNEHTEFEESSLMEWLTLPDLYWMYLTDFFVFAENQATLLNITAIPIFAFFSWAFLSGKKYNYAENLIINTFITAQQLFFLLLLVPVLEAFPAVREYVIPVYVGTVLIYNAWVYAQLYEGKRFMTARCIVVALLAYVYQFPMNLGLFFVYENYVHTHTIVSTIIDH